MDLGWTVVGSLVVAFGSALAGLYSFRGRIAVVMVGFLLFILGYRLSQVGTHTDGGVLGELLPAVGAASRRRVAGRAALLVVGWAGIATGVTLFSQTILDPGVARAAVSGVASIGGYMCAHRGLNGVGWGDSVFDPVQEYVAGPPGDRS